MSPDPPSPRPDPPSPRPGALRAVVDRWASAERTGDSTSLDAVLHTEFVFAGPCGYPLDRSAWMARFTPSDPHETSFSTFTFTPDVPARLVHDTALVIGTRRQTGDHQGEFASAGRVGAT